MKDILKELWHGNISPWEDFYPNNAEMKQLLGYIADDHDDLVKKLSEENCKILERYSENLLEFEGLTLEALFGYAFSLGVRLAVACLSEG